MEEKPKIVITRSRRPEPVTRAFTFTSDMVPAEETLKDYRQHAWETYARLRKPGAGRTCACCLRIRFACLKMRRSANSHLSRTTCSGH
jgi:hypothetical protein